jgi:ribosomal protein L7/L12
MAKITKEDVIGFIEKMTVLELSELVKELEEKFGVSAAAMPNLMSFFNQRVRKRSKLSRWSVLLLTWD